jgi:hypothetical protein
MDAQSVDDKLASTDRKHEENMNSGPVYRSQQMQNGE